VIQFRDADEARAWDGYAAALRSGDYHTFADLTSDADALLEERRKRFALRCGACESPFPDCCSQRLPDRRST
jgi:hypothetical protein